MNRKISLRIIMFILVFGFPFGTLIAQGIEYPDSDEWFRLAIEQYGVTVPVEKNRLELDKAPFTLVLITRGPLGVLVNCSERDTLYKGFLKNKPLEEILEEPDLYMGIGEAPGNADEIILIDEVAPHYLYYKDSDSHRYSSTEQRDGYVIGRRVIANYTTFANDFNPIPIDQLAADSLYFSLMYSEYDDNYNVIELQKKALKVTFR